MLKTHKISAETFIWLSQMKLPRIWKIQNMNQLYQRASLNKQMVSLSKQIVSGWVYTFSAMLSSLRNWANHNRYRLRPSTPAQLCWSSSRLQPLQNNNLNKFAIIRPSNLHHNKNLWNCCRGAPDETTCLTGFFRCPSALALICMKLFNICANKLSLSLSDGYYSCVKS